MNYHHLYHAGNFADVFKHSILTLLAQSLLVKEKPFCYLDTHAGTGLYNLHEPAAQKTKEYETGLLRLLNQPNHPSILNFYLKIIQELNPRGGAEADSLPRAACEHGRVPQRQDPEATEFQTEEFIKLYPGSPLLINHFLRKQDSMILIDSYLETAQQLKILFRHHKHIAVHNQDGYQAIKAFLPPKERRGLVLIDPPYEQPDEFQKIATALKEGLKRWETGIYAIWYPIKDKQITDQFLNKVKKQVTQEILVAEIIIHADDIKTTLNGCGMIIINPPWQLDTQLNELVPWLWQILSPAKKGDYCVKLL